jgi:hypothetical protein
MIPIVKVCKARLWGVLFLTVIMGSDFAACQGSVAPVYDPYSNGDLYIVGGPNSTWTGAEAQAVGLGGNLITIHSAAEDSFVASALYTDFTSSGGPNLSDAVGLWIGLTDPAGLIQDDGAGAQHAADFGWVDGEKATYRDWNAGEPNDGNGGPHEYYSLMWGPGSSQIATAGSSNPTGTWNDMPNSFTDFYTGTSGYFGVAVVSVPEPADVGLLGVGAVLLFRPRKRCLA